MPVNIVPSPCDLPIPPTPRPWDWLCLLGTLERNPALPLRTTTDARGRSWVLIPFGLRPFEADAAREELEGSGFETGGAIGYAMGSEELGILAELLAQYGPETPADGDAPARP